MSKYVDDLIPDCANETDEQPFLDYLPENPPIGKLRCDTSKNVFFSYYEICNYDTYNLMDIYAEMCHRNTHPLARDSHQPHRKHFPMLHVAVFLHLSCPA